MSRGEAAEEKTIPEKGRKIAEAKRCTCIACNPEETRLGPHRTGSRGPLGGVRSG